MKLPPILQGYRTYLLAGSIAFIITLFVSVSWAGEMSASQVKILGGGTRVGLFITAGDARMLIVDGSDAAAFGNALSAARHPGFDRVDVLMLSGTDSSYPVVVRMIDTVSAPANLAAGPIALNRRLPWPYSLQMASDTRIELAPDVAIETETAAGDKSPQEHWRITITLNDQVIQLLSDTSAVDLFSWGRPVSLLIVQRGDLEELNGFSQATVLAMPSTLLESYEVESWLATAEHTDYVIRVFPGEAHTVKLTEDGLQLPAETIRR